MFFVSCLCHCLLLRRGSLNHATPDEKQFRPSVLGGMEGPFFFSFFFSNRVCRKSLLLSGVTEEGSFTSLTPGRWKILLRESQRGTVSGSRAHRASVGGGASRAGWRGGRAGEGGGGPSGRAALPAALKDPTMQRWRPSSVTMSLPAPANRRGAGGAAGERRL